MYKRMNFREAQTYLQLMSKIYFPGVENVL